MSINPMDITMDYDITTLRDVHVERLQLNNCSRWLGDGVDAVSTNWVVAWVGW